MAESIGNVSRAFPLKSHEEHGTHGDMPTDIRIPKESFFNMVPVVAGLVAILCFAYVWLGYNANPERTMFSYLFAYASVISIMLGCLAFVLIQHLTRAGWSVGLRRIPESAMMSAIFFSLLFIPIALGYSHLFSWHHIEHGDTVLEAKAAYLNVPFFMIRSCIYLVSWVAIGYWFYKISVGQDDGQRREDTRKMWGTSAPAMFVFALTISFASFDWLMSLQPHWYSTIFGVYFFAGSFQSAIAFIILMLFLVQRAGALHKSINKEHFHDLGKLMFAFTVFWTYIGFSQFMLYWYANVPEEVVFYYHRLHNGWEYISWIMPVSHFFFPFLFLLSRHVKKQLFALGAMCVWIILMHFVDIFWLVLPNFGAHHGEGHAPAMHVTLLDVFAVLGMLSVLVAVTSFLLTKTNAIPTGDPRLKESLVFENF